MHAMKTVGAIAATCSSLFVTQSDAAPQFMNAVVIPGDTLDATKQPGANQGRLGSSRISTTIWSARNGGLGRSFDPEGIVVDPAPTT